MPENEKTQGPVTPADAGPPGAEATSPRRGRARRIVLLALGPVLVVVAGTFVYINTGRYSQTDNAYVKSDTVIISAVVAGPIKHIAVHENERVHAGDVLFEIEDSPYRALVERGQAQIEAVESYIASLKASYQQQLERLELARIDVAYNERELARQQGLAARQLGSDADVDSARHDFEVARQQIPIIEQALEQLRVQIGGQIAPGLDAKGVLAGNAAYRTVVAMLEAARIDLDNTVVRAPFDGIVTRVPTIGRYVAPGSPVMSVVSEGDVWIEANYKETELTHVVPGQPVAIRIDTYPDREWRGTVESISPAAGSEFSVIPAQNASGNWVKVAQRIPVRIAVDVAPGDPRLRAGMSAVVEIDTGFEREAPEFLRFLRRQSAAGSAPVAHQD